MPRRTTFSEGTSPPTIDSEFWDANTVTHVLGVRAFGTQLLCEQVVGRALRRMSYAVNDGGMFDAEYADESAANLRPPTDQRGVSA